MMKAIVHCDQCNTELFEYNESVVGNPAKEISEYQCRYCYDTLHYCQKCFEVVTDWDDKRINVCHHHAKVVENRILISNVLLETMKDICDELNVKHTIHYTGSVLNITLIFDENIVPLSYTNIINRDKTRSQSNQNFTLRVNKSDGRWDINLTSPYSTMKALISDAIAHGISWEKQIHIKYKESAQKEMERQRNAIGFHQNSIDQMDIILNKLDYDPFNGEDNE